MAVDDALLDLERRLLSDSAGQWLNDIAEVKRLYNLKSPTLLGFIQGLAPSLDPEALSSGVLEAYGIGGQYAATTALADTTLTDAHKAAIARAATTGSTSLLNGVDKLASDAEAALRTALLLAGSGGSIDDIVGPLFGNGNATRARIIDMVHRAGASATTNVAKAANKPTVWVAERNACVRCLAHSGHYVNAGEAFPAGLTYGEHAYDDGVKQCPLHPHCRCHLEILNSLEYAAALRREADRSVLRGYSLESESMGVRLRAADKLIKGGVDAPKSVVGFAERAIKRGEFPTRIVPKVKQPRQGPPPGSPTGPPTAPPKPPRAPKAPKAAAPLSKALADVSNVGEMGKLAGARHPSTDWSVWGTMRGLDEGNSRIAIGQASKLLDEFPGAKLTEVKPYTIRNTGVFAQVRTPIKRNPKTFLKENGTPGMEISAGFLRNPQRHRDLIDESTKSGHFHNVSGDDAMLHTVTHEFGHVLDANTENALSLLFVKMKNEALKANGATFKSGRLTGYSTEAYEWSKANISGYGNTSAAEGVAELFAEGYLKGDKAAPFAQSFYRAAMDLLKEKGLTS